MEKENMFLNEVNCSSPPPENCFFNPNWDVSMDQNDPFESAMSSMVSSSPAGIVGDNIVIRELIGRIGSNICNSVEISPQLSYASTNNTVLSPTELKLSWLKHQICRGNLQVPAKPSSTDLGFAERAARYSRFSNQSAGALSAQLGLNDAGLPRGSPTELNSVKLSGVLRNQSIKISGSPMPIQENNDGPPLQDGISTYGKKFSSFSRSSTPETAEFHESREISSVSDANYKKRKGVPRGKAKVIPLSNPANVASENSKSTTKRSKLDDDDDDKGRRNGKKHSKDDNSKAAEPPPKDYIHVRARRGQATDAHSLAERVRREKIGERMKLLQDLVPGCNKVTGKAVMLDEIINYVQSLQRQVEFLSMKLATVNPTKQLNMEALLTKDMFQSCGAIHQNLQPSDSFPFECHQGPNLHSVVPSEVNVAFPTNLFNDATGRNQSKQRLPVDNFSQVVSTFWEDDLHSLAQMGIGQNQTKFSWEFSPRHK